MGSYWIFSYSYDSSLCIAHYPILIEGQVASIIVDHASLLVEPGQVVSVEVDDSVVFENPVSSGTILVPYYVDLFFLSFTRGFQTGSLRPLRVKLRRLSAHLRVKEVDCSAC